MVSTKEAAYSLVYFGLTYVLVFTYLIPSIGMALLFGLIFAFLPLLFRHDEILYFFAIFYGYFIGRDIIGSIFGSLFVILGFMLPVYAYNKYWLNKK